MVITNTELRGRYERPAIAGREPIAGLLAAPPSDGGGGGTDTQ